MSAQRNPISVVASFRDSTVWFQFMHFQRPSQLGCSGRSSYMVSCTRSAGTRARCGTFGVPPAACGRLRTFTDLLWQVCYRCCSGDDYDHQGHSENDTWVYEKRGILLGIPTIRSVVFCCILGVLFLGKSPEVVAIIAFCCYVVVAGAVCCKSVATSENVVS